MASATDSTRAAVSSFFNGFAAGDMGAVFGALADDVEYVVNSRDTATKEAIPWSDTFRGKDAVQAFFVRLTGAFDVLAFKLDTVLADGGEAAAFGSFLYRAKATGKEAPTEWAARIAVEGGKITKYQFFEDSYAIARAFVTKGKWTVKPEPTAEESEVPL
ncbi:hypothetical protein DFJ74DRAFT_671398 [Hyaloraphidium curvatum]|nr:hypothetical protein DFJ74DRAFT_671398 [Hyaloraphidium curvatum]